MSKVFPKYLKSQHNSENLCSASISPQHPVNRLVQEIRYLSCSQHFLCLQNLLQFCDQIFGSWSVPVNPTVL